MNTRRALLAMAILVGGGLLGFMAGVSVGQDKKTDPPVYELRTYTTLPGRFPRSTGDSPTTP